MWLLIRAMPIGAQVAIAAVVIGVIGTAYGLWHYRVYSSGYGAAISDIAKRDAAATAAVKAQTSRVSDCFANGGTWNTVEGRCD